MMWNYDPFELFKAFGVGIFVDLILVLLDLQLFLQLLILL